MTGDVEEYTCTVCGLSANHASMGGPGICPACDCGRFRGGRRWDFGDVMLCRKDSSPEQKAEFQKRAAEYAA